METNKIGPGAISVVIVSFNREKQLRESLAALHEEPAVPDRSPAVSSGVSVSPSQASAETAGHFQILVVDNGSRDGSASLDDEFPDVRFSRLPRNFGLTRALNIGIRAADRDYVLLLHDDVRISRSAVVALAEFLDKRPDVAAVCPLLNGPQVRSLPTPSDPDPTPRPAVAGGAEIVAECVSGAAIMVRAAFLRAMGHVDERYGNYGSDIELCARVRSSNRKLVVLSGIAAQHNTTPSPMSGSALDGDHAAGTAAFLSKHHGFAAGLLYRVRVSILALFSFRFSVLGGAKIDGSW
jgi:GT2 family glycosyltransferase